MNLCQPPRAVTRSPTLVVPENACDCHCHIIGPEARYPVSPSRTFTAPDALTDAYLRMAGTLGIERMVIVQPSFYGTDNSRTVDAIAELGQHRARGVAAVSPDISQDDLCALDAAGIRAARFITTAGGGAAIADLETVARKIAPLGWHVELYVPPVSWPDILPTLAKLPVPAVLDHMAALSADEARNDPAVVAAILRLLDAGKAWVKLCGYRASAAGHPYADVPPLAKLLIAHAPSRCVWGSDWPHTAIAGHMPDDGDLIDLLLDWEPDEAVRKAILVDNPARLYGFDT
ncbi:hydrolase [Bosea caraganae]|uniref:Hydrolase n=1 Tax=Bosea caraganae TaxID=2763117 RepID=A0A370L0G9_9HYPH|nr:amidohydrolase family protein [Bosea caraganae]RDJ20352.1 hydrolase [Bosea caraganae]RDJ26567.1 hydrolase [Bosea caraganae]